MMYVKIIAPGKLKESYLRDACAEYQKRLQAFCRLEITELPAQKLPPDPSEAQIAQALEREANDIVRAIPSGARVYALCIEGKRFTSEQLSADLAQAAVDGAGTVAFLIGSSYGLSLRVKRMAHVRLSMSDMTFPHQLARVMLLEQIYRAFQIRQGGKYHK